MLPNATIRDILRMYRNGEVSEDEAASALEGLRIEVIDGMARIDAGRSVRCGMPEVVLAEGKEPEAFANHARAGEDCRKVRRNTGLGGAS